MKRTPVLPFLGGVFLVATLTFSSCTHEPVGVDAQPEVCFETEVRPIILANCAKSGCHSGGDEMDLSTESSILSHVTPFKPDESNLYTSLTSTWSNPMPPSPNPPLTLQQRSTIALWILQGAGTSCGS